MNIILAFNLHSLTHSSDVYSDKLLQPTNTCHSHTCISTEHWPYKTNLNTELNSQTKAGFSKASKSRDNLASIHILLYYKYIYDAFGVRHYREMKYLVCWWEEPVIKDVLRCLVGKHTVYIGSNGLMRANAKLNIYMVCDGLFVWLTWHH